VYKEAGRFVRLKKEEKMNVIDITGLEKSYGPRRIISGATLAVAEGEKVGVIGRNGCGKSTLLRILAGLEDSDGGSMVRKRGLVATYLPQEPELDPDRTIRQTLDGCLVEAQSMISRFQELAHALPKAAPEEAQRLLAEQQEVQGWLDLHGGWSLDHKVAQVCDRLGITDLDQRVGNLSGGWTKRVALAGVLLQEPELLLLDEPTNHLDADTVAWLEEILRGYPGAVVLVTHDRYFLDRVATRMFELDGGAMTVYGGGYSAYLEQKQERLSQEGRAQSRLMNLLRREEAWLKRGAKARTTKQKARIDRVEGLREEKKDLRTREVKLDFGQQQRLGGTVLELDDLNVNLGGQTLIGCLSFLMRRGERIGVLGPNGCGKTTLLKTVLGQLTPESGRVVLGARTRIGYLDQERSGLDPERFVHEALGEGDWVTLPGGDKRHKIGYLEDFLFSAAEQRKRISTLSGGERARLLLAKLMLEGANLLILDEPTNDLDIPTLQVLEEAFNDFPGCLLVVTHDRWFLDRVATGILHFEGEGKVTYYEGNYADLRRFQELQGQAAREEARAAQTSPVKRSAPKKRPGLTYKERLELEEVEGRIAALEERLNELEGLLAEPETIGGDHLRLALTADEFTAVEAELATLLDRWEELELKKEGPVA
jgi:ATP-binding cassette subfamily F protein uup